MAIKFKEMRISCQNRIYTLLLILFLVVCMYSFFKLHVDNYPLEVQKMADSHAEAGVAASDGRIGDGGRDDTQNSGGGFFGKMPAKEDEDWGKKACPVSELVNVDDFYNYINHRPLRCDRAVLVGGQRKTHPPYLEGAKWVCVSEHMNLVPGKCLVYSFGISRDFTFDDEMDNKFMCEVHSFDPTIGMETHQRSSRATFHNLGLSNVSNPHHPTFKVETYANILKQLGHTDAVLDYLKIDIEGYEINFFQDVFKNYPNLLKNVKQIGMEVHPMKGGLKCKQLWRHFQQMECYGFRLWTSEANQVRANMFTVKGSRRSCCYELVWARDKVW